MTRSEHHESAPRGLLACPQGGEDRSTVERQEGMERGPNGREGRPVRARVGHEQDQDLGPAVTLLERQLPFERLGVIDSGLSLHVCRPRIGPDHGVPRPKVAVDREGHFRRHPDRRMELATQTRKERLLRPIAKRVPGGIGPQHELETDHGAACADEVGVRRTDLASLEPTDARVGCSNRPADRPQAEAGTDAGLAKVGRDAAHADARLPSTPIARSFPRRHRHGGWQLALTCDLPGPSGVVVPPAFQPTLGRPAPTPYAPPTRPVVPPAFQRAPRAREARPCA